MSVIESNIDYFNTVLSVSNCSLGPGTVVSGRFGPLTYATPQAKRKSKSIIMGTVIAATGSKMYKVRFENGFETETESCKLKVIREEDIPPTLRVSSDENDSDHEEESLGGSLSGIPDQTCNQETHDDDVPAEIGPDEHMPESQETHATLLSVSTENNEEDNARDLPLSYADKLLAARNKISDLTGDTIERRYKNDSIIWRVIEEHRCDAPARSPTAVGLKPEVLTEVIQEETMVASEIFLCLMFGGNVVEAVTKANRAVQEYNESNQRATPVPLFTHVEFLRGIAVMIGSVCFSASGNQLWKKPSQDSEDFITVEPKAEFYKWMSGFRFKEFRQFLPSIYEDPTKKDTDPWWRFIGGVEQFNMNCLKYIVSSNRLAMDELMMAWRPRKTKTGGLPNITFILRKPEPLGTEYKCSTCSSCNVMLYMEIQRGKEEMKKQKYNRDLGATAGCTLRLAEAW